MGLEWWLIAYLYVVGAVSLYLVAADGGGDGAIETLAVSALWPVAFPFMIVVFVTTTIWETRTWFRRD